MMNKKRERSSDAIIGEPVRSEPTCLEAQGARASRPKEHAALGLKEARVRVQAYVQRSPYTSVTHHVEDEHSQRTIFGPFC